MTQSTKKEAPAALQTLGGIADNIEEYRRATHRINHIRKQEPHT
jgi:hypothetical protein